MINLDKFDNLNLKLLEKLNEDYTLLTENKDIFSDDSDPLDSSVTNSKLKLNKATDEKKKAYKLTKTAPKEAQKMVRLKHKKEIVAEKEAESQKAKLNYAKYAKKLSETNEELNIDLFTDDDIYSLAEEFEFDLNEASNIDSVIDNIEDKVSESKEDAKEEIQKIQEDNKEDQQELASEKKEEKFEQSQDAENELEKNKKIAEDKIERIQTKQEQTMVKMNRQLEKAKEIKKAEAPDSNANTQKTVPNSNATTMQNVTNSEKMTEAFNPIKAIKSKIANHKFDKLSEKKGKLTLKIVDLEKKLKEATDAGKEKKAERIQEKLEKLYNKFKEVSVQYQKQNEKLVQLGEDYQLLDSIDKLCESIDNLILEIDLDPIINDHEVNPLYEQYKYVIEYHYEEPMAKKIVNTINEEFNKGNQCDNSKIKILINKLKNFKG